MTNSSLRSWRFFAALALMVNLPAWATLRINEFVADNDGSFLDEDGDASDWIEIFNSGDVPVSTNGLTLTDNAAAPALWPLPDLTIPPAGYLVIFASGKDRRDSASELHTNFSLSSDGEYLALIDTDGFSPLTEFSPGFPQQFLGVAYGFGFNSAVEDATFVPWPASGKWIVPDAATGATWNEPGFDDTAWNTTQTGIGFGYTFPGYIGPGGDTRSEMLSKSASAYLRIPFQIDDPAEVVEMNLDLFYEDGFAAFLNGTLVASSNIPDPLLFDSDATDAGEVFADDEMETFPLDFFGELLPGENILAFQMLNSTAGSNDVLLVPMLRAKVRDLSGGLLEGYLAGPTPGTPNSGVEFSGLVQDTAFDVDRGFFENPFVANITSDTPGATIVYTTNGSEPTLTNGTAVTAPDANTAPSAQVNITTSTVLRAAAFKSGLRPTNVDTQTYLFLDDVIQQPNNPPNTTTTWAGKIADYEMDPEVVNDPIDGGDVLPALKAFPSLSLTIDPEDFYGPNGIYQNPLSEGSDWERSVSAELISHDGSESGFQIDAGLRVQGGSSRNPDTPKHSLSLRFRTQYGQGKLRYNLFRDAPKGRDAVDKFDYLQLRANYNYGFSHRHFWQCDKAQYNRDTFTNDLFLEMGNIGVHGRWTHLYINGVYWGLYCLHERPDQDFMEAYFGGEDTDYDAINKGQTQGGSLTRYTTMAGISRGNIASSAVYETLQTHLDLDSFIDYMMLNFYIGNNDWDSNNWRAAGMGPTGVPFHYFPWDSEFAISTPRNSPGYLDIANALNINRTGQNNRNNRPSGIHQDLTQNAEYRLRFADRAHARLFNGGPLSPEGASAIWQRRSDKMDQAIVAESARWGDYRRDVQADGGWQQNDYTLYTKANPYLTTQNFILNTYLPQRSGIFLAQLRSRNLYPSVDAPVYQQTGNALTMTNPNQAGAIFYTTDGSDPRDAGAQLYQTTINLTQSATYRSRVLEDGVWSALQVTDILTGTPADASNLVISEIFYNQPGPGEDQEFIEFANISGNVIDLGNITFTDGLTYTFPLNTTLGPGQRLVLTPADYEGNLDNGGETLTLVDASGEVIESLTFNDKHPWTEAADGEGYSLVRISPGSRLGANLPESWRASTAIGGTPGSTDATTFGGGNLLTYALQGRNLVATTTGVEVPRNLAADDLIHEVEMSTDLESWDTISSPVSETLPLSGFTTQTYLAPQASPNRYYRLRIILR